MIENLNEETLNEYRRVAYYYYKNNLTHEEIEALNIDFDNTSGKELTLDELLQG